MAKVEGTFLVNVVMRWLELALARRKWLRKWGKTDDHRGSIRQSSLYVANECPKVLRISSGNDESAEMDRRLKSAHFAHAIIWCERINERIHSFGTGHIAFTRIDGHFHFPNGRDLWPATVQRMFPTYLVWMHEQNCGQRWIIENIYIIITEFSGQHYLGSIIGWNRQ